MIDDVLNELRQAIEKSKDALRRETAKLRTGRAHPSMLDSIRVDYYGQTTPLGQMATVSVPEPRLLTVKPWDKSQVKAAEKALRESDLGLNPQVDGDLIRIPIPPLSEERRKDLGHLPRWSVRQPRQPTLRRSARPLDTRPLLPAAVHAPPRRCRLPT